MLPEGSNYRQVKLHPDLSTCTCRQKCIKLTKKHAANYIKLKSAEKNNIKLNSNALQANLST